MLTAGNKLAPPKLLREYQDASSYIKTFDDATDISQNIEGISYLLYREMKAVVIATVKLMILTISCRLSTMPPIFNSNARNESNVRASFTTSLILIDIDYSRNACHEAMTGKWSMTRLY